MAELWVPAPGPDPAANRAAVQAAIDACAAAGGGTVRLAGRHLLAGGGPQLLLTRRAIRLVGEGGGGSEIAVDASVGPETDVLAYEPVDWTEGSFFAVRDLRIVPAAGRPARRGVVLRPRPGSVVVRSFLLADCEIGAFGGAAVAVDNGTANAPLAAPGVFTGSLRDGRFAGGLDFTAGADSIRLVDSTVFGPGRIVVDLIAGAALFQMRGCNVTCAGGLRVDGCHHLDVTGNYFEWLAAEAPDPGNGALIDLNGASRALLRPVVADNTINAALPGDGRSCVRVGNARHALVADNDVCTEAGVYAVRLGAEARHSRVHGNVQYGAGHVVSNGGDPFFAPTPLGPPSGLGPPAGQGQSAQSLANKLRAALIAAGLGVP